MGTVDSAPRPRPAPFFLGGHLALDFLNSYTVPAGCPIELMAHGAGFAGWYRQAGLAESLAARARLAALTVAELDELAGCARALRESIRSGLRSGLDLRLNRALRILLDHWMAKGSGFQQFGSTENGFELVVQDRCGDAEQLLVPLATAAARLFVEEDLTRVRACEGPICGLLFIDRSKPGTRRYCSPETCGNRAKAAAFRERERRPHAQWRWP